MEENVRNLRRTFLLEDFTSNFRSVGVIVFEAQSYFEKIIQQPRIIQYESSCLPYVFDRQIADFQDD